MKRILVFAPHPDDDVLGCGGSIAKWKARAYEVYVAYMSSGESGSLDYSKSDLQAIREEEARKAGLALGVDHFVFLHFPDGYIEMNRDSLIPLVKLIREVKPEWVYTPHSGDQVRDHLLTHQLVIEACRRAAGPWFQECTLAPHNVLNILGYEVWTPIQNPAYIEDITEYMPGKMEAILQHQSQISDIAYHEGIEGLNRYRGAMSGRGRYCECFEIVRICPNKDAQNE